MTGCKLNSLMLKLPWGLFTYSVTTATRGNNTKLTNQIKKDNNVRKQYKLTLSTNFKY